VVRAWRILRRGRAPDRRRRAGDPRGAGLRACVTGFLGIWVCRYADDQDDADADTISVAYYLAKPLDDESVAFDRAEVAGVQWFLLDALPSALAPPGILEAIVAAAAPRIVAGDLETPLPDRPG
jgi:hypothetical protein